MFALEIRHNYASELDEANDRPDVTNPIMGLVIDRTVIGHYHVADVIIASSKFQLIQLIMKSGRKIRKVDDLRG